jgi:hypothetical protein
MYSSDTYSSGRERKLEKAWKLDAGGFLERDPTTWQYLMSKKTKDNFPKSLWDLAEGWAMRS